MREDRVWAKGFVVRKEDRKFFLEKDRKKVSTLSVFFPSVMDM